MYRMPSLIPRPSRQELGVGRPGNETIECPPRILPSKLHVNAYFIAQYIELDSIPVCSIRICKIN